MRVVREPSSTAIASQASEAPLARTNAPRRTGGIARDIVSIAVTRNVDVRAVVDTPWIPHKADRTLVAGRASETTRAVAVATGAVCCRGDGAGVTVAAHSNIHACIGAIRVALEAGCTHRAGPPSETAATGAGTIVVRPERVPRDHRNRVPGA